VSQPRIILASTSRYRAGLLQRLTADFEQVGPECDETPAADDIPLLLAERLAHEKAMSVARRHPDALVIGSDQVASLKGAMLGKPGDHATAVKQLGDCSDNNVDFYTAVSVVRLSDDTVHRHVDHTRVCFKKLSDNVIEQYLQKEQPYDCAGSFKSEALGVVLFDHIDSTDPTALIGLPLIWLAQTLGDCGVELL